MSPGKSIRLIVADIDGCLTTGYGEAFDLEIFQQLQRINRQSQSESHIPAITFCTGRPQPYVEAIIQLCGTPLPVVCESGGVFYSMQGRRLEIHPRFDRATQDALARLTHAAEDQLVGHLPVVIEPGKITQLTLIPMAPLTVEEILPTAQQILQTSNGLYTIDHTSICINFSPRMINKGVGLRWLAEKTGISPEEMAGIGDSTSDRTFLELVGTAGAVRNAVEPVKQIAHYVSPYAYARGVLDFIEFCIAQNRQL
jgi:HAD superfamily hydrolase (TIGR01484 family)